MNMKVEKTLNRKNIDVFLSAGQAIDYDIYRKLPIFEKIYYGN